MSWVKIFGIFLVAVLFTAAFALAEVNPEVAPVTPGLGEVSGEKGATIRSDITLSEPADGDLAEKGALPITGEHPKTEAVPGGEVAPEDVVAPGGEPPPATPAGPDNGEPEGSGGDLTIADPIEPWNRVIFQFNDKLYFWVLKPISLGYNVVFPEVVRISVRDFFRNAIMPVRFVNSLLQGKIKEAGTELARFAINSTVGLGGFFDVAKSRFELEAQHEDLGQTLGWYGMPGLMYIVWPLFGPSTLRDSIGLAGDVFLAPISYIKPIEVPLGAFSYGLINATSLKLGEYEDMKKLAVEPYISARDAYIQRRRVQINK